MNTKDVSLINHLEEFRKRVMIVLGTFLIILVGAFIFVQDIYKWIVDDFGVKLAVLSPTEIIWVYVMISGIIAIAITIPIAAFQAWLFVRPALFPHERKVTLAYIPALFVLFIGGISFGYFVIFPIVLKFLMALAGDMFTTYYTTEKFFKFLLHMTIPFGVLFELPVVTMFLTSLGVVNPLKLREMRKYAYFILVVISILITPPDFLSDILVIIPLFILYECSIILSLIVYKRKIAKQSAVAV